MISRRSRHGKADCEALAFQLGTASTSQRIPRRQRRHHDSQGCRAQTRRGRRLEEPADGAMSDPLLLSWDLGSDRLSDQAGGCDAGDIRAVRQAIGRALMRATLESRTYPRTRERRHRALASTCPRKAALARRRKCSAGRGLKVQRSSANHRSRRPRREELIKSKASDSRRADGKTSSSATASTAC
jgi:hypothetical protein